MFKTFFNLTFITIFIFLTSCSEENESSKKTPASPKNEVILYNWKEYTSLDVLKKFEQQTGIKVILKEFDTIEEQIGTLQSNPYFCLHISSRVNSAIRITPEEGQQFTLVEFSG